MTLTWTGLVLLCLAGALVWFWQDSLRARERANAAAVEACTRLALQFLDGTVAFARLQLVRDSGRLRLRRTYVFDYTANSVERRQGFVMLIGRQLETVGYATSETAGASVTTPSPSSAQPAEVLRLSEFRTRERTQELPKTPED